MKPLARTSLRVILLLTFFWQQLHAQNGQEELTYAYWLPESLHTTFQDARNHQIEGNETGYPNFGETPNGAWVKIELPESMRPGRQYSFLTRGVDSLRFYLINKQGVVVQQAETGSHFDPYESARPSPYTTFSFRLGREAPYQLYIFAKNQDYKLSLYPFLLDTATTVQKTVDTRHRVQNIYVGSMGILLLFGFTLFVLLRHKLYLFYAFCVVLSLSMMMVNYEYPYLIWDELPEFIRNKNIYGYITTLLPLNYFFFAKKFLVYPERIKNWINKYQKYFVATTLGILTFFALTGLSFFQYRNLIEPIIFVLVLGPIYLAISSLRAGYVPAKLFLIATSPVLLMMVLESVSEIHNLPVQLMHTLYYVATFIELFVLTIGLSFKFKNYQDERNSVYENIITREFTVREQERRRIANDLHDRLGGMLATVSFQLNVFKDKLNSNQEAEAIENSIRLLDESSKTARDLSHTYESSSFLKLGIVEVLEEMYRFAENPRIYINNIGFDERMEPKKENALYDVIQEILTNAIKHAKATEISVNFSEKEGEITVGILDDGVGFDLEKYKRGLGIRNIEFRVREHLNGTVTYRSEPGVGTTIKIIFARD